MPPIKLIADSGATKTEWCLLDKGKKKTIFTQGISPYHLNVAQLKDLLEKELTPKLFPAKGSGKGKEISEIFYYGTGCANPNNAAMVKKAISQVFTKAKVKVDHDMTAAARGLCGHEQGMACNLGTGSFACYYNGKKIQQSRPGIGYILGDEGSGAFLGRKVVQYYLYQTFDEELMMKFDLRFKTNKMEILENVYKKPLANRYLAGFAMFLAENRGHYMVENIIEDGLNDFFFLHLCKFRQTWTLPVSFVGSIAFGFKDVLQDLCSAYEFEPGRILKNAMSGLVDYHS
jgi:N-acetylglucosamine kinase-like BadF-type ATPase